MSSYQQFAYLYDYLMREAPYDQWLSLWDGIWEQVDVCSVSSQPDQHRERPLKVADIGCGTGRLCFALAEKGHQVWGIDMSDDMLVVAEEKKSAAPLPVRKRIQFLCQDMRDLQLTEKVDIVVSFCDSINYLHSAEDLQTTFANLYAILNQGGLLVFDLLAIEKMRSTIGNQKHFEVADDTVCIWQNQWDEEQHKLHYDLTFFVQEEDNLYSRFDEYHIQTGFTINLVRQCLLDQGFVILKEFADFDLDKAIGDATDRYFWAVKKIETT